LEAVRAQNREYEGKREQLKELEAVNRKVEEALIKRNKHTDLTMRTIQIEFDQLGTAIEKKEKLLTNEILTKKNSDITPQQLDEFKEVFQHFDKDNSGALNRLELKSCLQSLGDEASDPELDTIMRKLDPEGTGTISFETFTRFMIERTKDSDSKGEILASFKSLANDKEFITPDDLRKVMSNDRVQYLITSMPPYEGVPNAYDYRKWAETAFS